MTTTNNDRLIAVTKSCIKTIDDMTDDLLEIADVLEEHQINVKHGERYLNPVGAIRTKVDVIWDEVQMISYQINEAVKIDGSER